MAEYTAVPVSDVPDRAADVGMDPDHFEIRLMREQLGLQNFAVTYERFGGRVEADARPSAHAPRRRSTSSCRGVPRRSSTAR